MHNEKLVRIESGIPGSMLVASVTVPLNAPDRLASILKAEARASKNGYVICWGREGDSDVGYCHENSKKTFK